MDATDLNKTLKDLMDGLSVKVFRTYNASITLDRLVWEPSDSEVVDAKKADYDRANKEVLSNWLSQTPYSAYLTLAGIFTLHAAVFINGVLFLQHLREHSGLQTALTVWCAENNACQVLFYKIRTA